MPEMQEVTRLRGLVVNRVAFVGAGDDPLAKVVIWKGREDSPGPEVLAKERELWEEVLKRTFTTEQRVALAKKGFAIPVRNDDGQVVDGRYPIENVADLINAARAIGRVAEGDRAKVVAHIKKRARALGATDRLGDTFKAVEDELGKAKGLTPGRLERLRQAYDHLGSVLDDAGGKEGNVPESTEKTLELPDDLPEDVRKRIADHVSGVEKERDDAAKERDEAKAELAKAGQPKSEESADEFAKALADEAVPDSVKALLRKEREDRESLEKARGEDRGRIEKLEEDAAYGLVLKEAEEFRHLSGKTEDLAAKLRQLDKADAEAGKVLREELRRAAAIASEAMAIIGKSDEPGEGSAQAKLEAMALEYAKAHSTPERTVTKEMAMVHVTETPEGKALMAQGRRESREEG